jgi:hypothetical protein
MINVSTLVKNMYETFATLQRFILTHMSPASTIGEIVELVGSFDKSWEDAAQTAVKEAVKTNNTVHFSKPPFYNIVNENVLASLGSESLCAHPLPS